jgi:hypothetical protein
MCPVGGTAAAAEIPAEQAFSENTAKNRNTLLAAICSDRRSGFAQGHQDLIGIKTAIPARQ